MSLDKDTQMLLAMERKILATVPGYARIIKQYSKFMWFLNFFVRIFNKDFMTRYTTTIHPKVYFPEEKMKDARAVWKTLAHEWVHMVHAEATPTWWYSLKYLFPHWLALLALMSLGAIWGGPWWLLNLCWLLCLAPLPAYLRSREEVSAYAMTMAVNYWRYGHVMPSTKERLVTHFTGSNYYFMWPFRKAVVRWLNTEEKKIVSGLYDNVAPYKDVKEMIENLWPKTT